MRKDILERKSDILAWISQERSKAYICKQLECKQDTLNAYLKKFNVKYSGTQGVKGRTANNKLTLLEYLKTQHPKSTIIRKKLIEFGHKEHSCEECMFTMWNGTPIPLELHHLDGDHENNVLDNFRLLCPNCHAQTDSYCKKKVIMES